MKTTVSSPKLSLFAQIPTIDINQRLLRIDFVFNTFTSLSDQ